MFVELIIHEKNGNETKITLIDTEFQKDFLWNNNVFVLLFKIYDERKDSNLIRNIIKAMEFWDKLKNGKGISVFIEQVISLIFISCPNAKKYKEEFDKYLLLI